MNKISKNRFITALKYAKDEVSKEDIIRCGEEYGITFPKRISRDNVIDKVSQEHFERLYETFQEFLYVPAWDVADYYNMSTEKINKLAEIGIIKEQPKEKEFYSRSNREHYTANTYPLEIFEYDKDYLQKSYDEAYGIAGYRLRLETKTQEEAKELVGIFDKIFEVTTDTDTYAHRNDDGYYSYFTIKKLSNSLLRKTAQRLEIDKLNKEIDKLKTEHKQEIQELKNKVVRELGLPGFSTYELMALKYDLDKLNKENTELKSELAELKEARSKAGRKKKLDVQQQEMVRVFKLRGDTVREIAKYFGVGVATVDRILNSKKGS